MIIYVIAGKANVLMMLNLVFYFVGLVNVKNPTKESTKTLTVTVNIILENPAKTEQSTEHDIFNIIIYVTFL